MGVKGINGWEAGKLECRKAKWLKSLPAFEHPSFHASNDSEQEYF